MAKRSKRNRADPVSATPVGPGSGDPRFGSTFRILLAEGWLPFLLAVTTFLVYWPSLQSDFVYDARSEIFEEGFITSLSNLPAVLSLKVLGMKLMLGGRPGQLLYLMLNAAVWGKDPWGYHLCGNLLHAANVALLFVLMLRLTKVELTGLTSAGFLKVRIAVCAATLIFALHPVVVEPVAAVSYSSDLLVTFFTLLALLAATAFRPDQMGAARLSGCAGTLCAFAAVTCKESGIAAVLLLIVYWFLFRRRETKGPWLMFLGAATAVTAAFLTARFLWAPRASGHLSYLGGSFSQALWIQPRLWVFMMGKLVWPRELSADYTLENMNELTTALAFTILIAVVSLQAWLAAKSRLGALGVATYWLGLATVSNFIPLYRIVADRFYYLPLAGAAMQLLALLLMTLGSRIGFWIAVAPFLAAIPPLTALTLDRQNVFSNQFSLWSNTIQVSPFSSTAHDNLGMELDDKGRVEAALVEYQKALEIDPNNAEAHDNFGNLLFNQGRVEEAIAQYHQALKIDPDLTKGHYNLGLALAQKKEMDEAIAEFQKTLALNPNLGEAHNNLGITLFQKGLISEAIIQFREALRLEPDNVDAQHNLEQVEAVVRQRPAPNVPQK